MNEQNGVELLQLNPQPTASVRETIPIEQIGPKTGEDAAALFAFIEQTGAKSVGPFFARYHTFTDTATDLEHGIPVAEPIMDAGAVFAGELPGGPAASTWHLEEHSKLGEAYQRISQWINDNGREPNGAAWEIYHWIDPNQPQESATAQDQSTWHVQLIQPLKD